VEAAWFGIFIGAVAGFLLGCVWTPKDGDLGNAGGWSFLIIGGAVILAGLATWTEVAVVGNTASSCPDGPIENA
jgi:hypothetical protein